MITTMLRRSPRQRCGRTCVWSGKRAKTSSICKRAIVSDPGWCPDFLIEQGIAVRAGARVLRNSLFAILENRKDEISPRMAKLIRGLYEDWCCLDERIETVTGEIEELSRIEPKCQRLMSVPGIGPLISTALVAAIGTGEAFDRGRDLGAWLGLVPRQYSTGGRSILGRISKRGSRYLRMLLVQAARVLLMRPHTWSRFSFGAWLKAASERLHRHKLAVALANKLARIAWSVLRHDKAFDTHLEIAAISPSRLSSRLRKCMERIDRRTRNLVPQMAAKRSCR